MRPSASSWSSMTGAGVVLGRESLRLALGGWHAHGEPSVRVAAASVERRTRGATLGIAGGAATEGAPAPERGAVSLYAARDDGTSFASGEVAMAEGRMRAVTRFVAGERREWSAIAIAGAGPAVDEPLVFTRRERWGAALERRDGWSWGASRAGVSSLLRRDAVSEMRRRRAFWDGEWRIRDDTRFELAARVTREDSDRGATGPLAAIPARATSDDWRARATLRAQHTNDQGWVMDNAYRIEWVQNRSGRPGTLVMWTWRLRAGAFDGRFSASAHALQREQVTYVAESMPLDTGDYSAMTGKGAAMTASLRLWLRRHAWLEATWAARAPAASRVWVALGLRG
jgi:hypothetical protein